ncbi:unnamed protein product [Victoria cruziana]
MDGLIKEDKWGYPVRTSSDACILAIDAYYQQVLSYGRNCKVIMDAVAEDKDCVMANVLAAVYRRNKLQLSAAHLAVAKANLERATSYEKSVYDAVSCSMVDGADDDTILSSQLELIKKYPRNLVSLKRAQIICFYLARPDFSLYLVEQVLPENKQEPYIYGMLSFPLLELGRMRDAETAAREGLSINKDDQWSQHALCHVLQYECRFKEAVEFMESSSMSWNSCSSFMITHNWWHVALCYLDGHLLHKAFEVYDQHIWHELDKDDADKSEVCLNALGFMLRADVRGYIDDNDFRLTTLAACVSDKTTWCLEWMVDILAIWAFTRTGEVSKAKDLLNAVKSRFRSLTAKKQQSMEKVVLLAEALYEYGRGDHFRAFDIVGPNFKVVDCKVMGASDEQLEVFTEVWYSILLGSGYTSEAIRELEKHVQVQQGVPFLWRLLEKAYLLAGSAHAEMAGQKAESLETAYFEQNV